MDILITIGLVYVAYRGYSWYQHLQNQVKGPSEFREVRKEEEDDRPDVVITKAPKAGDDDYIEYEEIK